MTARRNGGFQMRQLGDACGTGSVFSLERSQHKGASGATEVGVAPSGGAQLDITLGLGRSPPQEPDARPGTPRRAAFRRREGAGSIRGVQPPVPIAVTRASTASLIPAG